MLSTGFLPGIFFRGGKSIVMQISIIILLCSDQISGRGKSFQGGQTALGGREEQAESQSIKLHTVRTRNNAT